MPTTKEPDEPKARKLSARDAQSPKGRRVIVDKVIERLICNRYWWLYALVAAGCSGDALEDFRKAMLAPVKCEGCGKSRKLQTAHCADVAIRAAKLATWGSDRQEGIDKNIKIHDLPETETVRNQLVHANWWAENGWIVAFARREGDEWEPEIRDWLDSHKETPTVLFRYDDEKVTGSRP